MKLVHENSKMGFPRILSKNNKIYTKLGEFCLSSDGNNFWILCHTCQEELQSQDHFWKHIQDEHNFLLSLKENVSNRSTTYMDCTEPGNIMPLPLYRKMQSDSEDNVQRNEMAEHDEDDSQQEHSQQPKDYTDMRNTLTATTDAVSIDIKVEPPNAVHNNNNNNQTIPITTAAAVAAAAVAQQQASNVAAALQLQSQSATIYQLPPVVPPSSSGAYATIVHGMPPAQHTAILKQDLIVPKDTNSATASASSAVSSEDGERWYICDHESCGLKFKYQSRLELHRSVHSKERKYACEICGASFKQSCNLSTHRKKKHFLKGTKSLINLPTQGGQQQQQPQTPQHHQQQLQQHTQQQHF